MKKVYDLAWWNVAQRNRGMDMEDYTIKSFSRVYRGIDDPVTLATSNVNIRLTALIMRRGES